MPDKKVQEEIPPTNPNTALVEKPDPALVKFVAKLFEQENQILRLWKEGVPPKYIQMQYPTYSQEDIIEICQSRYNIDNLDFKLLDGALFVGYMEDMGTLEKWLSTTNNLGEKLSIMNVKLSARDRAVRLRQLIETMYHTKSNSPDDEEEGDTVTGSLELRLKRRFASAKTPEEKIKMIQELEGLEAEFLEGQLIEEDNVS